MAQINKKTNSKKRNPTTFLMWSVILLLVLGAGCVGTAFLVDQTKTTFKAPINTIDENIIPDPVTPSLPNENDPKPGTITAPVPEIPILPGIVSPNNPFGGGDKPKAPNENDQPIIVDDEVPTIGDLSSNLIGFDDEISGLERYTLENYATTIGKSLDDITNYFFLADFAYAEVSNIFNFELEGLFFSGVYDQSATSAVPIQEYWYCVYLNTFDAWNGLYVRALIVLYFGPSDLLPEHGSIEFTGFYFPDYDSYQYDNSGDVRALTFYW